MDPLADSRWIRCFCVNATTRLSEEFPKEKVPEMLAEGKVFWIDILNPDKKDTSWLRRTFKFHKLALTDVLNNSVRPKQELYDDVLFTVFNAINLNPGEEALDTINLNIFLTNNYIVSTHCKPLKTIRDTIKKIEEKKGLLEKGPDHLYYLLLDGVINRYFDIQDELEEEIQAIEEEIFDEGASDLQARLFTLRKKLTFAKRSINPKRDALRTLVYEGFPQLNAETQTLLRDVLDHVLRISETLESFRELVSGLRDSLMTQISNQMNEVMKLMSIIATVMLPLSFLTGIFGMNFENMPGLTFGAAGFWGLILVMVALAGLIVWAFRKNNIL